MFRFLPLAAAVVLVAGTAAQSQSMPAAVTGTWRIAKILPTKNTQCWDAVRAGSLLGTTLRYVPGKLTWKGVDYPITEAFTRTLSSQKFNTEYKFDLAALGLRGPSIEEIDLQHEDADITGATTEIPGDTILLAGPGRIVVSACGVFYSATRVSR